MTPPELQSKKAERGSPIAHKKQHRTRPHSQRGLLAWDGDEQGLHMAREALGVGLGICDGDLVAVRDDALQLVLTPLPQVVQLQGRTI